jgi:hypothetical protein
MEARKVYCRPDVQTLSTVDVLESLGPVSAGSSRVDELDCKVGQDCGGDRG